MKKKKFYGNLLLEQGKMTLEPIIKWTEECIKEVEEYN
jgi:hypothetical protein